jgi:hypothetical protein
MISAPIFTSPSASVVMDQDAAFAGSAKMGGKLTGRSKMMVDNAHANVTTNSR